VLETGQAWGLGGRTPVRLWGADCATGTEGWEEEEGGKDEGGREEDDATVISLSLFTVEVEASDKKRR
jgi:hypothetical protein